MAEEVVKYKIQIDDSDVANQLQEIRNQMDLSLASAAGSATALSPQFSASSLPSLAFSAGTPDISSALGSFGLGTGTIGGPGFFNSMSADFDHTLSDMRAGANMMRQDFTQFFSQSPGSTSQNSFLGMLGFGYDTTMPVFKSEYQNYYADKFADTAGSVGASLGTTAAMAGLAALPIPGARVLAVAGEITSFAIEPWLNDIRKQEADIDNIQRLSQGITGGVGFYESTARQVYNNINRQADAIELSQEDASRYIMEYAGAGGFANRSASQLASDMPNLPVSLTMLSKLYGTPAGDVFDEQGNRTMMGLSSYAGIFDKAGIIRSDESLNDTFIRMYGQAQALDVNPDAYMQSVAMTAAVPRPTTLNQQTMGRIAEQSTIAAVRLAQQRPNIEMAYGGIGGLARNIADMESAGINDRMLPFYAAALESGMSPDEVYGAGMLDLLAPMGDVLAQGPEALFGLVGRAENVVYDQYGMSTSKLAQARIQRLAKPFLSGTATSDELEGFAHLAMGMSREDFDKQRITATATIDQAEVKRGEAEARNKIAVEKSKVSFGRQMYNYFRTTPLGQMVEGFDKTMETIASGYASVEDYISDTIKGIQADATGQVIIGQVDLANPEQEDITNYLKVQAYSRATGQSEEEILKQVAGGSKPFGFQTPEIKKKYEEEVQLIKEGMTKASQTVFTGDVAEPSWGAGTSSDPGRDAETVNLLNQKTAARSTVAAHTVSSYTDPTDNTGYFFAAGDRNRKVTSVPGKPRYDRNGMHIGWDFEGKKGDEVQSGFTGKVIAIGNEKGGGKFVTLEVGEGDDKRRISYHHLQNLSKEVYESYRDKEKFITDPGTVIGEIYDNHLHVEVESPDNNSFYIGGLGTRGDENLSANDRMDLSKMVAFRKHSSLSTSGEMQAFQREQYEAAIADPSIARTLFPSATRDQLTAMSTDTKDPEMRELLRKLLELLDKLYSGGTVGKFRLVGSQGN